MCVLINGAFLYRIGKLRLGWSQSPRGGRAAGNMPKHVNGRPTVSADQSPVMEGSSLASSWDALRGFLETDFSTVSIALLAASFGFADG